MDLKRGIDKAVAAAVEALQAQSTPCTDSSAIAQVGSISANSDTEVGEIIAEADVHEHEARSRLSGLDDGVLTRGDEPRDFVAEPLQRAVV